MNYLTNYYKNLSEQLEKQIDVLNKKINLLKESEGPVLGRVTFKDWMVSRYGPQWQTIIPRQNLQLFQKFMEKYPNGMPPNIWTKKPIDVMNNEHQKELERVNINPYPRDYKEPEWKGYGHPVGEDLWDLEWKVIEKGSEWLQGLASVNPAENDTN